MKESYIKLPNITVSKLQDVVDYLDENNIEYIEDYKEEVELNKYKEVLDKIKEILGNYKHYSTPDEKQNAENEEIVDKAYELLEEIE